MAKFPGETVYGKTKLLGEQLVKESGIDFVIFRPTIVFGPHDKKNISLLINMARKMPFAFVIGNGSNKWQPVFVDDLAEAIAVSISKKGAIGKTFEIGGKEPISYMQIVLAIIDEFQLKKPVLRIPKEPLIFAAFIAEKLPFFGQDGTFEFSRKRIEMLSIDRTMDISQAKKILSFKPRSFRDSLILTMKGDNLV